MFARVTIGDKGKLNYGEGSATADEANRLGKIGVGDGAQKHRGEVGLVQMEQGGIYLQC